MKEIKSHDFPKVYKKLNINLNTLGCVMLDLEPLDNMWSIEVDGAGTALYYAKNPERKWIDGWVVGKVAHITLLYGLMDNAHNLENEVSTVLSGWQLDEVEIDHVGYFDSPYDDEDYYCIVAHIKVTDDLIEGHQRLELLPHINTFTGYKPHMTICYLAKKEDKEQSEKYRDTMIEYFNDLWAGKKLKVKPTINLGYKPSEKLSTHGTIVKQGQVWRSNKTKEKIGIVAVSNDKKECFVSGVVDFVDPLWEISYLLKEYHLDKKYEDD